MSLRAMSVFKPSPCCRGDSYCFSLNSKETTIIDLRDNFFLTATWLPNGQLWATVEGGSLTKSMLLTASATYSTQRSPGALQPSE